MTVKSYPNGEDAESIFDYLWIRVSDNHAEQLQKAGREYYFSGRHAPTVE